MNEAEKSLHTPEPWSVVAAEYDIAESIGCDYVIEQRNFVGNVKWSIAYSDNEFDASRIVACVNACAGLTTEELEDNGTGGLKQWMEDADETLKAVCDALDDVDYSGRCEQGIYALKQQRDELLSEIKDCIRLLELAKEAAEQRDELLAAAVEYRAAAHTSREHEFSVALDEVIAKNRGQHE